MGQCASRGNGPIQGSQVLSQGRQHPAGEEEVQGHKLETEALMLKAHKDNVTPSYKPLVKTAPSCVYSIPHRVAAKDLLHSCVLNDAKDVLSDCQQCQGGVHDYAAGPPVCANETGRIENFKAYGLDNFFEPCPEVDNVLQTVCRVFSVQYAAFALFHNKTCWQCNTVGYGSGELTWNLTACPWNLMCAMPQTIACGDLREDARYADMPWTRQGLRTYVSAPLLASNGERLGSCCFLDNVPRKVDAGMCRLLNNFSEIAVRVLERHLGLAARLAQAKQAAMQLSDATVYLPPPLPEPMKPPDSCPIEDHHQQQQQQQQQQQRQQQQQQLQVVKGSDFDKAGSALVVKEGGWVQQLQDAGPEAQAAAVAAACLSYGAWWGEDANSAAAASTAATAAVAEVEGKSGLGGSKGGALQQAPNPQLQLCNAFQKEVRNTARTADACVLLVDTGHPDWPVIYADETWKEWAGYSRDAILGRGLFELLQPAAPSVAPCRREQLQTEAQAGARFVLHGQVVVPQGARESDLMRAMSTTGSVVSVPTLHTSGPGVSSTQMAQEKASECALHSVDSDMVLGQPKRGPSSFDSLGSNVVAPQRGAPSMSRKEETFMSMEGLHQRQQEHVRQSLDFPGAAAKTSPFHSCFLTNSIDGVPQAPLPAASPKEQPKIFDDLLQTHSGIKSEHPSSTNLWHAGPSTDTLTPVPFAQASNRKSFGSDTKADKAGRSQVFDLSFRSAALDVLDCDALPLGVPSFVPMETSGRLLSLYMVRLHKRGEEVVQPANKPFEPSAKVTRVGQANPSLLAPRFFPGFRVQQVLGAGGYGTVYQGQWHDAQVVLKVQDYMLTSAKELLEARLEVILGQLLNHPNLVHTLAHATVELPPDSLVPFSQAKQASRMQKASKARATHNKRSSLDAPAGPCRLSFQGPRPPSCQDTHNTNDTPKRRTPSTAHATPAGPDCAAAPSHTAAPCDAFARSSAGSHAETGSIAAARSEKGGLGMGRGGTLADDMMRGEGNAADEVEGDGGWKDFSKSQEGEVGGQLSDELNEDDGEQLNDDPAFWFSNADACVHRLPAMLSSLGHSLNLDLSTILDNALTSIASLSHHSFNDGNAALPTVVPPNLPTVQSWESNIVSTQGSNIGKPAAASEPTTTNHHPSHTDGTITAASSTEGGGSRGSSSCAASSMLVSSNTGKPSPLSKAQTMGDGAQDEQASGSNAAGGTNKLSPFSAVQDLNKSVSGGGGQGNTSPPNLGRGQPKVDSQQGLPQGGSATAGAADVLSEGSSVGGAQKMMPGDGSCVADSMGAKVDQLLAEAETRVQKHKKQALSFPMCVRTLTMMELCDSGSLQDAIDRGWLRDGPCSVFTPVDIVKVVHVALDIASALEYLHSVGVVHADLSAGNVLLTRLPPGVKRHTGVTCATHSSSDNMQQQQQQQQQQQVANPLCSNPAAAPAPAGASPSAASTQSFAATPMPSVPEGVPVTPGVDMGGPGSANKLSPQASCGSGGTPNDIGSATGALGHDYLAELRGEFKGDGMGDPCEADLSVPSDVGKFAASPPVRRYQLGSPTPKTARDMQFVAKVCDYGKARLLSPTGIVKAQAYATITHMAPEVLTDLLLSPAADMYAFGVLLWQMVCCSRPWPMMSHQQIFAVVSCNSAQLPWPKTAPLIRPPGTQTCQASGSTTSAGGTGMNTLNAEVEGASGAAQGAGVSHPADASSDVPVLGGAPAEAAAVTGACTTVPPELVELGKACLSHDRLARPSAATAVAMLRNLLACLEAV